MLFTFRSSILSLSFLLCVLLSCLTMAQDIPNTYIVEFKVSMCSKTAETPAIDLFRQFLSDNNLADKVEERYVYDSEVYCGVSLETDTDTLNKIREFPGFVGISPVV
ncbi:hypothetical protein BDF19DRAFT_438454, partial [Syncephalis fuscata]